MNKNLFLIVAGAFIAGLGVLGFARSRAKTAAPASAGSPDPLPSFDGTPGNPAK